MKVLLLTVVPEPSTYGASGIDHCCLEKLLECARKDRFREHSLTNDPEEADIIIFAEMGFSSAMGYFDAKLRRHPFVKRYREKCFATHSADQVIPFLPGVYASIERRWYDPRRVRTGHYLSSHIKEPPLITRPHAERDLLFSFVGSAANHPVREEIVALEHPNTLLRDVSGDARSVWAQGKKAVDGFLTDYSTVLSRSRFSLCPRGIGTSSIRLFESMRFGVAPVIISDGWVAPTGPDWDSFSIRIRERAVRHLPRLVEEHDGRSEEMGRLARAAWEHWFSDEVSFHRIVEWCREIMETRRGSNDPPLRRARAYSQALLPENLRMLARDVYRARARLKE